jgi:predicted nuclease of predicted toxin-antitoxin system
MRVLFDQATPVQIRRFLVGHSVRTAAQQAWDRFRNGDLLTVAERAGFDVLVTPDQSMRSQQNLTGRRLAIVVLGSGRWPIIRPCVPQIVAAVNAATPGSYIEVEIPT